MGTNVIVSANNILKLIALVILAGVVFGKISRKVKLPDVVLFILAGVILGPEVLNLINIDSYPVGNQLILTFGAAYILYDGGREIDLKVFNEVLTIILRMMIFVLLGSHIDFAVLAKYFTKDLLVVVLLIFISRPVSAFLSVIFDRKAKWNIKEMIYLMWVRETGVIPAALVGMLLTMHIKNADIIASVTFTTIIITLTFQASTAKSLAKLLKLDVDECKEQIAVDSIRIENI